MKLSFHGAEYDYHPSNIKVIEAQAGGVYRGSLWKIHRVLRRQQRRSQSQVALTYRGVHYTR